jgi:hypothetical protein
VRAHTWVRRLIGTCAAVLAVWPRAAAAVPASAPVGVRVWYRSSEGCPDGAAFIGLLRRFGREASLASVGDRVDFVVTVAYAPGASTGRLERQSSERTVAIRDVSASSCEEVTEVLALSLDLAEQPGAQPVAAVDSAWALGAHATIETGLAHETLFGGALFVALSPALQHLHARFSLRGAYGERDSDVPLKIGLGAARVEACWTWSLGDVALGPCAGVELGLVLAQSSGDNGRDDVGGWSSALAHGRGSWQLGRLVALEAQAGVLVPFVRYRFSAEAGGDITDSAALGFQAALGFSFRL